MMELISYCILSLCFVWTLGLMLYMVIESNQDKDKLEMEMATHAKREWQC